MEHDHEFDETLGDESKPWQRQSITRDGKKIYESGKAHAAFREYRSMGSTRSVREVARRLAKSRTLVQRWAQRWHWAERAKAYDNFLEQKESEAFIAERIRMARRQAATAQLGQDIALQGLVELQAKLQRKRHRQLTSTETARLFEICSKIERICRGEPEDDQVASVHVHISERLRPRYEELSDDPEKYDA